MMQVLKAVALKDVGFKQVLKQKRGFKMAGKC